MPVGPLQEAACDFCLGMPDPAQQHLPGQDEVPRQCFSSRLGSLLLG